MSTDSNTANGPSIAARLNDAIDPDHPIPIYLQIASSVRGEIASGRLPIGSSLPSVRSLGRSLGISYHTVRHAWDLLVEEGVLSVRRGRGAVVLASPAATDAWHLTPSAHDTGVERPVAWVVGAQWSHAAAIAGQLMDRHAISAVPWRLDAGMPPPGPVLLLDGTPLPEGWHPRRRESHALPTTLPRDAVPAIRRAADLLGTREVRVVMAEPPGPDLSALMRQLPRVGLSVRGWSGADHAILDETERVVVVAENGIDAAGATADPRVLILGRTPAAGPLAGLARELHWRTM